MSLGEYLELSRWDRFKLHEKLSDFIKEKNGEIEGGAESEEAAPRTARRQGAF